jgi:acetyl esterase
MPLDPIAVGFLKQLAEANMPPLHHLSPADARTAAQGFRALSGEPEAVADVTDRTVPGPGGPLPARVYTPARAAGGPLPCLVYYHGGGWVFGEIEGVDAICRAVANRAGRKVVSIEYRLAPEHKFPAPLDGLLCGAHVGRGERTAVGRGHHASRSRRRQRRRQSCGGSHLARAG